MYLNQFLKQEFLQQYNNQIQNIIIFYKMNFSCANKSGNQSLVQKLIRLQNECSPDHELVKVYFQYLPRTRQINLSKVMKDLASNGFPIQNSQLFYWDYDRKMFVYIGNYPFKDQYFLKYENFQQNVIHIRYRRINIQSQHRNPQLKIQRDNKINSSRMEIESRLDKNAKRVKERSIQQVIQMVSKWRFLYQKVDSNGKKLHTLQSAAREVGISKKTLDDYYLQLKYGQTYNFDFQYHKDAKIGVLRAFVKLYHKGNKKQSQPLKMLSKSNYSEVASTTVKYIEDYAVPDHLSSSDEQDVQAYLFHRDHSCEFSDQN